jgi:hypothetical protein
MGAKITGLKELRADLEKYETEIVGEVRGVVAKGALNIKKDVRRAWANLRHAPALPRSVGYDVKVRGLTVTAEVGPDKSKRQGALGVFLEYGSVHNAPRPALAPAADAEEPRLASALEDINADLLEGKRKQGSAPADSG